MQISQQTFLKRVASLLLAALVFFTSFAASLQSSYSETATGYGVGRTRTCDAQGVPEGLNFDMTTAGKDAEFVLANPVCLALVASTYATVKLSVAAMNYVCKTGSAVPRIVPSPLQDSADIIRAGIKATNTSDQACASQTAKAFTNWTAVIGVLEGIFAIAEDSYKNTEVCGKNWVTSNPMTYDISSPNYKKTVQDAVEDSMRKGESSKLTLDYAAGDEGKAYREWYYGGVEVEDNVGKDEECLDVTQLVDGKYPRQRYYMHGTAAGNFNCKKYDVAAANGADPLDKSHKTQLSEARIAELQKAYNCCKSRAAGYICLHINRTGENRFCKAGELCLISNKESEVDITYSTKFLDDGSLICAESYSLCPYNFTISGGSEYCDYYQDGKWDDKAGRWTMITQDDVVAGNCKSKSEIRNDDCSYNAKANKCRNYCQYLTHCTVTSSSTYHYKSSLGSPYFSDACINFVGDSQNQTSYDLDGKGLIINSQKHFSAPIAQCIKETMESLFNNVASHSECASTNEYPSPDGICPSGNYVTGGDIITDEDGGNAHPFIYKKGNQVKAASFFSILQNSLQAAVKLVLTLSVMFYGMNILMGKADIREKKDILMYLLKIALVLYFATGNAWQSSFFKGVYGASPELSRMVFRIDAGQAENRRDGCQFGMISVTSKLMDGSTVVSEESSGRTYPAGKEYLALWDTLDCKMMRYLGYGPEASVANIAMLILSGYFSFSIPFTGGTVTTAGVGIYLAMAAMFFGFFFVAITLRALHIFLASVMGIIILVFVSPIVIPTALFSKTADIFKRWVAELMGYCLQPMILFAYIAFMITVMDKALIGSATFAGNAPSKTISCSKYCQNADGSIEPYVNGKFPDCADQGDEVINPMNDSVACIVNLNDFGTMPGLEMLGMVLPIMGSIFMDNMKIKILTLLKGAMVIYLLYRFMDLISGISTKLVGGSALSGSAEDPLKRLNKVVSSLKKIQKRAVGAGKKLGRKGLEKAGQARAAIGSMGKMGGSGGGGGNGGGESGADRSGSSDGGGADKGGDSDSGDSGENSSGGDK